VGRIGAPVDGAGWLSEASGSAIPGWDWHGWNGEDGMRGCQTDRQSERS